jgi:hypothetical protein
VLYLSSQGSRAGESSGFQGDVLAFSLVFRGSCDLGRLGERLRSCLFIALPFG